MLFGETCYLCQVIVSLGPIAPRKHSSYSASGLWLTRDALALDHVGSQVLYIYDDARQQREPCTHAPSLQSNKCRSFDHYLPSIYIKRVNSFINGTSALSLRSWFIVWGGRSAVLLVKPCEKPDLTRSYFLLGLNNCEKVLERSLTRLIPWTNSPCIFLVPFACFIIYSRILPSVGTSFSFFAFRYVFFWLLCSLRGHFRSF